MSTTPTLYEWCGGHDALLRLTEVFYGRVLADPVLEPVFRHMGPHHREHVALWLGEVFGGPTTYTDEQGAMAGIHRRVGHPHRQGQRGRLGNSPAGPAVASMGMGRGTALRGLTSCQEPRRRAVRGWTSRACPS